LHLFLRDFGEALARMPAVMPEKQPAGRDDVTTLRWAVRSDGVGGFVFVNNYERLRPMPAKKDVQFTLKLPSGPFTFPSEPVTIPADSCFFWPFNLDLGHGVRLAWATAQPVCAVDKDNVRTVFFARTESVPAQFAFASADSGVTVYEIEPGREAALTRPSSEGATVRIVVLSESDSLGLWKEAWQGRQRVLLTHAGFVVDGDTIRLTSSDPDELTVDIYPAPPLVTFDGNTIEREADGVFARFAPGTPSVVTPRIELEDVRPAGPPRTIPLGKIRQAAAAAPQDTDFEQAAIWRVKLPAALDLNTDPILRLHYVGDVARVTLNGKLLTDDFYNGKAFDVGLRRYAPEILEGELHVAILPLRRGAPIHMAEEAQPDFGSSQSIVALKRVEIVLRYQVQLSAAPEPLTDGAETEDIY
jgi:hypothetical protein